MATEASWIRKRSTDLIMGAMERAGISAVTLSECTGIPFTRLARKLVGGSDFTFSELYLIAEALRVRPSAFVPRMSPPAAA